MGLVLADFQENEHKNEGRSRRRKQHVMCRNPFQPSSTGLCCSHLHQQQRRLFIRVQYPLFAKLVALQVFKYRGIVAMASIDFDVLMAVS